MARPTVKLTKLWQTYTWHTRDNIRQKQITIPFALQANGTFSGIGRLKVFIASLDTTIGKLRTDETFKGRLQGLLELAKSPFIQSVIKSANIDFKMIQAIMNGLMYDDVSTF